MEKIKELFWVICYLLSRILEVTGRLILSMIYLATVMMVYIHSGDTEFSDVFIICYSIMLLWSVLPLVNKLLELRLKI